MRKLIPVLALLIAAALVALLATGRMLADHPRSSVSADGNYRLVASDGAIFERSFLAGRPYVTYFGYASCPDRCPTMLSRLARLRGEMGIAPNDLPIVFITVDPRHDTPERLAAFVRTLGIPIHALTGDEQVINKVLDNAGVFVRVIDQPGGGYRIEHTTAAFLYDASGDFSEAIAPDDGDGVVRAKLARARAGAAIGNPADDATPIAPATNRAP